MIRLWYHELQPWYNGLSCFFPRLQGLLSFPYSFLLYSIDCFPRWLIMPKVFLSCYLLFVLCTFFFYAFQSPLLCELPLSTTLFRFDNFLQFPGTPGHHYCFLLSSLKFFFFLLITTCRLSYTGAFLPPSPVFRASRRLFYTWGFLTSSIGITGLPSSLLYRGFLAPSPVFRASRRLFSPGLFVSGLPDILSLLPFCRSVFTLLPCTLGSNPSLTGILPLYPGPSKLSLS